MSILRDEYLSFRVSSLPRGRPVHSIINTLRAKGSYCFPLLGDVVSYSTKVGCFGCAGIDCDAADAARIMELHFDSYSWA